MPMPGTETGLLPYADYYIKKLISEFSLKQSSGYRPNAITEFGTRSLHGLRLASDLTGSPANMQKAYNAAITFPNVKEVIYNGRIYTPSRGEHRYSGKNKHIDHVHVGFSTVTNNMGSYGIPSGSSIKPVSDLLHGFNEPLINNIFTGLLYLIIGIIILLSLYKVFAPEVKGVTQAALKVASKGVL